MGTVQLAIIILLSVSVSIVIIVEKNSRPHITNEKPKKKFSVSQNSNQNQFEESYIEELKELSELKEKGIITEEEFNEKKATILKNNL